MNKEWIDEYLNEAHSKGLISVRCHCNVMAWSDDRDELKLIRNDVGSQLALMECKPRHNTVDTPTLFWAGIPGNEADFPAEESFYTFLGQALCLFVEETNYKSSLSPFGIKMVDRVSGRPLHIDISDLPMKKGITTNRNKFILGPSGVSTAVMSALLAVEGKCVTSAEGIIDDDVDRSIRNLTAIGREGMAATDRLVLDIMTHKKPADCGR